MILLGLGSNLPTAAYGGPRENCEAALAALAAEGVAILRRSRWYESAPVPPSDQPWFVNGVAAVATGLSPEACLALCHRIERRFGRERRQKNASRTLDLDLLAWDDRRLEGGSAGVTVPHPRLHERAFVLLPLAEVVAPDWRHPTLGLTLEALIRRLAQGQVAFPLPGEEGGAP